MCEPDNLPDVPDQLDEDALLNTGPVATTGEDTFGVTLDDIPF